MAPGYDPHVAFRGWPAEAIEFFEGLEANNSKSFWLANNKVYEETVKRPMVALLGELEGEFGPGKLFRPYRDVRFSKDKSPYKTNIAASVGSSGYVTLSADGLGVGSGMYMMAPDQLERFRRAVADGRSGADLTSIVTTIRELGYACAVNDSLKTAPKGYPKDHPRIDLLRGKAREFGFQLIMSSNDRFVMNKAPLEEWCVLQRRGNRVRVRNYENSREAFEEFKFTGLGNFDFFATDFLEEEEAPAAP